MTILKNTLKPECKVPQQQRRQCRGYGQSIAKSLFKTGRAKFAGSNEFIRIFEKQISFWVTSSGSELENFFCENPFRGF